MKVRPAIIYVVVAITAGAAAGAIAGWRAGRAAGQHNAPTASSTNAPLAIPDLKGMNRQQVLDAVKGTGITVTFKIDTRADAREAVGPGRVTGWSSPAIGVRRPLTPGTQLQVRLSPE